MDDLSDLYQQVILDHNRRPRNFGKLESANHHAEGHNPGCGDRVVVHVNLKGDIIQEIAFEGSGCAISRASASLMMGAVEGKALSEADHLAQQFQEMVTGDPTVALEGRKVEQLGRLAALGGIRAFPGRVKCATMAWHALRAAVSSSEPSDPSA